MFCVCVTYTSIHVCCGHSIHLGLIQVACSKMFMLNDGIISPQFERNPGRMAACCKKFSDLK